MNDRIDELVFYPTNTYRRTKLERDRYSRRRKTLKFGENRHSDIPLNSYSVEFDQLSARRLAALPCNMRLEIDGFKRLE